MSAYSEHPTILRWLEHGYPFSICTDDHGVFATSLSEEILHVATAFDLTRKQVLQLVRGAADYGFSTQQDTAAMLAQEAVRKGCDETAA